VISSQAKLGHTTAFKRWFVLVCLLLLSVTVVAQSHLHPDDSASALKHCSICQVAHSSAQIAVVAQLQVAFAASGYLGSAQDHDQLLDLFSAWHFSRPPPLA
jgi:hypothetical protein